MQIVQFHEKDQDTLIEQPVILIYSVIGGHSDIITPI